MGFLVLTLCVPMNTVFAEGTNGHSKEVQSISLQEDSQKEEKSENENLQVPTESVTGENIDDSGNVDFPQEPEVPSSEWTSGWNFYEGNWYYAKEENTLYFGWIYLNSKWYSDQFFRRQVYDKFACFFQHPIGIPLRPYGYICHGRVRADGSCPGNCNNVALSFPIRRGHHNGRNRIYHISRFPEHAAITGAVFIVFFLSHFSYPLYSKPTMYHSKK